MSGAAIIGAGSWGTALASVLGHKGHRVSLWSHNPTVAEQIRGERQNREYLPGIELPETVEISMDFAEALHDSEYVVCVVPSHAVRETMTRAAPHIPAEAIVISATKGLEVETLERPSQIIEEVLPDRRPPGVLSGPSFAREVGEGDPTAVVIASRSPEVARAAQELFSTRRFRVYTNEDVLGVETAAALKNIIALAAGIADGLGYRHNSLAALITRGLAEMTRLGVAIGARRSTFAGLAGLGDLVLTCTADLSRNRTVGQRLGRGESLEGILSGMRMVAEGVRTTAAARQLAMEHATEMPIVAEVHAILFDGKSPKQATGDLMLRDPKPEYWGSADAT